MLELENSKYFITLPAHIKESIIQSGIDFNNEDELKSFVSNLK